MIDEIIIKHLFNITIIQPQRKKKNLIRPALKHNLKALHSHCNQNSRSRLHVIIHI